MWSCAILSIFNIRSYNAKYKVTLQSTSIPPTSPADISLMKWVFGGGIGGVIFFIWEMQSFVKPGAIIFSSDCMACSYRAIFPSGILIWISKSSANCVSIIGLYFSCTGPRFSLFKQIWISQLPLALRALRSCYPFLLAQEPCFRLYQKELLFLHFCLHLWRKQKLQHAF